MQKMKMNLFEILFLPILFTLIESENPKTSIHNIKDERSPRVPRQDGASSKSANGIGPSAKNAPYFQPISNELPTFSAKDKVFFEYIIGIYVYLQMKRGRNLLGIASKSNGFCE